MKKRWIKFLGFVGCSLAPLQLLASQNQSYGDMAQGLFGNEMVVRGIIQAICITAGAGLIFGGLLQIRRHFKNPTEVPVSTPIVSIIAGLALIGLSFIPLQV